MSIPRDVQEFLDGYPGVSDNKRSTANFDFYRNEKRCRPDNLLIEEIHEQWKGDYRTLEWNHGYIQWLFPIQEHGMNYQSQPLQRHEIVSMNTDATIRKRILTSYELMLDFYGMRLLDTQSGLLDRSIAPRNYESRYENLCSSPHNNLRISRILKCLSEFGYERLNLGFLLHFLNEQSEHSELNTRAIIGSMDRWWANCVRNEDERVWVNNKIKAVRKGEPFTRGDYVSCINEWKEKRDSRESSEGQVEEKGT